MFIIDEVRHRVCDALFTFIFEDFPNKIIPLNEFARHVKAEFIPPHFHHSSHQREEEKRHLIAQTSVPERLLVSEEICNAVVKMIKNHFELADDAFTNSGTQARTCDVPHASLSPSALHTRKRFTLLPAPSGTHVTHVIRPSWQKLGPRTESWRNVPGAPGWRAEARGWNAGVSAVDSVSPPPAPTSRFSMWRSLRVKLRRIHPQPRDRT